MNEPVGDEFSKQLKDGTDPGILDVSDELSDDGDDGASEREGLPSGFRMRHDAHYVDELLSRDLHRDVPPRTKAVLTPPLKPASEPLKSVPVHADALALVAERLVMVNAHASSLSPGVGGSALIARAVQAELARVTRLARAAVLLDAAPAPVRRPVTAGELADAAMAHAEPAARAAGLACEIAVDDPSFEVPADAAMVELGIAGTVDALIDLLRAPREQPRRAAGLSLHIQCVTVRPAIIVDVICPALHIASPLAERVFDNRREDYGDAPAAGLLLAAAAHIGRAHGGRADMKRHAGTGVTVTFVFPQALLEPRLG